MINEAYEVLQAYSCKKEAYITVIRKEPETENAGRI